MKVNVIIKGERRWDYKIRQRHNPSLAGDGGEHHITTRGRGRLCLGEKWFIYQESRNCKVLRVKEKHHELLTSGSFGQVLLV